MSNYLLFREENSRSAGVYEHHVTACRDLAGAYIGEESRKGFAGVDRIDQDAFPPGQKLDGLSAFFAWAFIARAVVVLVDDEFLSGHFIFAAKTKQFYGLARESG